MTLEQLCARRAPIIMALEQLYASRKLIVEQITLSGLKSRFSGTLAVGGLCASHVANIVLASNPHDPDSLLAHVFPTVTAITGVYAIRHVYLAFIGRRNLKQVNNDIENARGHSFTGIDAIKGILRLLRAY